jgi:CRISPR-associated protein Csb2
MGRQLVLTVHLHDRYHGMAGGNPEWPPAPARLFQALLAGAARGRAVPPEIEEALRWLEEQVPPTIAAPRAVLGSRVELFVPNNDADSLADPTEVGSIRTPKAVHPRIPERQALLYAWPIAEEGGGEAARIADLANAVYQVGRGVDMAWATGEIVDDETLDELLQGYDGDVRTPDPRGREAVLACPAPGSLESLLRRHRTTRLRTEGAGRKTRTIFSNAPKPLFVGVGYAPILTQLLFDLKQLEDADRAFVARPSEVVSLIERLRDGAAERLRAALPASTEAIERSLIGRRPQEPAGGPIGHRIRIVPLPSVGHEHVDRGVRRVLIEVPSGSPLRADDVEWAFTGLSPLDSATGEVDERMILVRSADEKMLGRYRAPARVWRSVTASALPESARRRRIDPRRIREEGKSAAERIAEETAAASAVRTALRHVGVRMAVRRVVVQREPFERRGLRAEAFAKPPRFAKERLWHIEITFAEPVAGPLVIGDGRFLGLGVMAPCTGRSVRIKSTKRSASSSGGED